MPYHDRKTRSISLVLDEPAGLFSGLTPRCHPVRHCRVGLMCGVREQYESQQHDRSTKRPVSHPFTI